MKKLIAIASFLYLSLLIISCSQESKETEATVLEFLEAMKAPVDFKKIKSLYKDFPLYNVPRVDQYNIQSTNKNEDNTFQTTINTSYTSSDGKKSEQLVLLTLQKENGQWIITDSKGLLDPKSSHKEAFSLGIKTGCIVKPEKSTDRELMNGLEKAKKLLMQFSQTNAGMISKLLEVKNVTWKPKGTKIEGKVLNKSKSSIREVGYLIQYLNSKGNRIGKHSGLISSDLGNPFPAESTFPISTKVDPIPAATKNLEIQFFVNPKDLHQMVTNATYTGKECATIQ